MKLCGWEEDMESHTLHFVTEDGLGMRQGMALEWDYQWPTVRLELALE